MYVPTGRWPVRGWVLMDRASYDQLDPYSTSLQLEVGDPRQATNVGTMLNLSIVQAKCVTRGLASDPNAVYLVEITDGRGLLRNKWFEDPTDVSYNIRAPAYPEVFHPYTMNGGTTWTWSTMLQDMWTRMDADVNGQPLKSWPGLPSAPLGTPEGFWFTGVSAWASFCDVLDYLGMTVACDLTKTNPYTIVSVGAADSTFTTLQTKYAGNLEDDLEWLDVGAGRLPGVVEVRFRRRNTVYGTEETVRYDTFQWDMVPFYSVSVNAPVGNGPGRGFMWADFTVRYDMDGNPLADDAATAMAIATERVTQYFAKLRSSGDLAQTYAGALPFATGSQVDGVCWYQDYRNDDRYGGWRTQVVRDDPPWRGLWSDS